MSSNKLGEKRFHETTKCPAWFVHRVDMPVASKRSSPARDHRFPVSERFQFSRPRPKVNKQSRPLDSLRIVFSALASVSILQRYLQEPRVPKWTKERLSIRAICVWFPDKRARNARAPIRCSESKR